MNIIITGKELKATEAIKEYVGKKMERIERYFEGSEIDVSVKIKTERAYQIAEMHCINCLQQVQPPQDKRNRNLSQFAPWDLFHRQIYKSMLFALLIVEQHTVCNFLS